MSLPTGHAAWWRCLGVFALGILCATATPASVDKTVYISSIAVRIIGQGAVNGCRESCVFSLVHVHELHAVGDPGWHLQGWEGACAFKGNPCPVQTVFISQCPSCPLMPIDQWTWAIFIENRPVPGDANGDGKADLFWREAPPGRGLSWWTMDGATVAGANYLEVGSEWQIAGLGDFDGDARSDILWRRATDGALYLWTLDGHAIKGFHDLGVVDPAAWSIAGVADFDGNARADILWRHADGTLYGWLMDGGAIIAQSEITSPDSGWVVVATPDSDDDGKAEIVFRHATSGEVVQWRMNGLAPAGASPHGAWDPSSWQLDAIADFDGDYRTDFLWRSPNGDTRVTPMDPWLPDASALIGNPGAGWAIHAVGDLDGDGTSDLVWRNAEGATYLWRIRGASPIAYEPLANPGGSWEIVAP